MKLSDLQTTTLALTLGIGAPPCRIVEYLDIKKESLSASNKALFEIGLLQKVLNPHKTFLDMPTINKERRKGSHVIPHPKKVNTQSHTWIAFNPQGQIFKDALYPPFWELTMPGSVVGPSIEEPNYDLLTTHLWEDYATRYISSFIKSSVPKKLFDTFFETFIKKVYFEKPFSKTEIKNAKKVRGYLKAPFQTHRYLAESVIQEFQIRFINHDPQIIKKQLEKLKKAPRKMVNREIAEEYLDLIKKDEKILVAEAERYQKQQEDIRITSARMMYQSLRDYYDLAPEEPLLLSELDSGKPPIPQDTPLRARQS